MKFNTKLLIPLISITLFSSCLKDTIDDLSNIKGAKATNDWSLPLVSMSMGMKELYESALQDANIHEDGNKLLVFSYHSEDDVPTQPNIPIPEVEFNYPIRMPAPVIQVFNFTNKFDLTIDTSISLPTDGGNQQIKKIKVKEGTFTVSLVNSFRHKVTVDISYPGISKNGVAYKEKVVLDYIEGGQYPREFTRTLDLADYDVDFSDGGTTFNKVGFSYAIAMVRDPLNATSTADSLSIGQKFAIKSYKEITGYLGRFEIIQNHIAQSIDLFTKQINGKILVNDPRLVLRIFNSYGVPVTGRIYNLKIITTDSQTFPVQIDAFKDTFSFVQPTIPGEVAESFYRIDKNNSNIDDAINSGPARVEFDVEFVANYNNIVQDNFLVDAAAFKTVVDFELPMDIKILDYEVLERTSFPLTALAGDIVDEAKLFVKTENGLPFDVFMQMLFVKDTIINGRLDSNYVVDSLFSHELAITGGTVDANGKVIAPFVSINTVGLPVKRLSRISSETKNALTRVRIQTSEFAGTPGFVKIYSDQKLSMKLGGNLKLILKSNAKL